MTKILIATKNPGKLSEISNFLKDLKIQTLSLKDIRINDDVVENGKNYKENSQKKAIYYAKKSGLPTIADDGGFEIDALGGAPGIKSRRWLGKESTDEEIIAHMLKISKTLPDSNRKAKFKTVVSFATPMGKVWSAEGQTIDGIIPKKPYLKISKGYPYRSFLYLPVVKKFYHEKDLSEKEQKLYNHRYKAIQKLLPIISKVLSI